MKSVAVSGYLWECDSPQGKMSLFCPETQEPLWINTEKPVSASGSKLGPPGQIQKRNPWGGGVGEWYEDKRKLSPR